MYTWGYLKEVALAKLDLAEDEAEVQNLLSRFPYFANEAITQICSSVMPKRTYAQFIVVEKEEDAVDGKILIGHQASMPSDFISFGDDVNERVYTSHNMNVSEEAHDDDFRYVGYNKVLFYKPGTYQISYNARWINFADTQIDNDTELDVPYDILDCIPPYIASQCFKIDNEYKASVYRNEYEMALARIDATDFKNTKTFKIGGDW